METKRSNNYDGGITGNIAKRPGPQLITSINTPVYSVHVKQ